MMRCKTCRQPVADYDPDDPSKGYWHIEIDYRGGSFATDGHFCSRRCMLDYVRKLASSAWDEYRRVEDYAETVGEARR